MAVYMRFCRDYVLLIGRRSNLRILGIAGLGLVLTMLLGCQGGDSSGDNAAFSEDEHHSPESDGVTVGHSQADFQVYKSPTCGCCGDWVEHLHDNGYSTSVHHPDNLTLLKAERGVAEQYQSCHTAVSQRGFIFEGHIPAWVITDFLAAPPEGAIGLAVPGMPIGSPGMEMGDRFSPYDVLLLREDGSSIVYRHIASIEQR